MDARGEIISLLKKKTKLSDIVLEVPPDASLGDFAFPCFALSKTLKKSPIVIAKELAAKIKISGIITSVKSNGPYVNFFISKGDVGKVLIKEIIKKASKYGMGSVKKEKVMIEFCQVNTHKSFHVGHLRGTLLGDSLVRIYKFAGYHTLAVNYQGDIGAHVAKVMWYLTNKKVTTPKEHKGRWLGEIYKKANALISKDPDKYKKILSDVLIKLEKGDTKLTSLWKKTRQWSLDDFDEFYSLAGIHFDRFFFESNLEKSGKKIVSKMFKDGLAIKDDGALLIDLDKLGKFLLLKSDGTALYSTKDLALAVEKFNKYKIDKSLYVVGAEQKLHFEQLFKTLEILGFKQAKQCKHISYGLVNLEGGKISSREGELIYAEELVEDIIEEASKAVLSRHKDVSKEEVATRSKQIGLAALKFSFVNQDNNKEILFDKAKSLSFEGETGPYVQYAHARIASILRKYDKFVPSKVMYGMLKTSTEGKLISLLGNFPSVVSNAASSNKASLVTRYLLDLSQAFNEFYHACDILTAEEDLQVARLSLIVAVKQVLANGLSLIGISAPEVM